jgi:hypothetical protein
MVMRVEVAPVGSLVFSLEQSTPKKWILSRAKHPDLPGAESLDQIVEMLVREGLAAVRAHIPSFVSGKLEISLDDSNPAFATEGGAGKDVVAVGNVTYLASEWDAYLQEQNGADRA